MKLRIPYSLFLIAAIILDRVIVSSKQINIGQSLRVLSILLAGTMVVSYVLYHHFVKDWHYTDFIVVMVPMTYLIYRSLYGFLKVKFPQYSIPLGLWLAFLIGLLYALSTHRKVWHLIRNPTQVSNYCYLVFTGLLCFQVMLLFQGERHVFAAADPAATPTSSDTSLVIHLQEETSPDIYVIVLDGYARQDVLQKIYGYDNSEFLEWLDQQGFYVAKNSHSNYVQTPYTMSSMWNLDYLQTWDSAYDYDRYLYQPIQENRVFHSLENIGYTTVSIAGEAHYAEIRNVDQYFSAFLPLNDFETFLLADSPLEPISNIVDLRLPLNSYKTHRQHIYYQFEKLKQIPTDISGPKIVYAHILSPHPPFVFDQYGDIRESEKPFTLAEGVAAQGSRGEYVEGYREQVQFLNVKIEMVIESILANSEMPPVIVLMGDHGPSSTFNFSVENYGCVWERTGNLYAVLLPGRETDSRLYPSISPVNTFRVIFNTYFGTDLPLLKDKSYLRFWQQPELNMDVTNQQDSMDGCDLPAENLLTD